MSQPSDLTPDSDASTPIGTAWGDDIASERKQQLWARLRAWWVEQDHDECAERRGPFAGETLTGADVFWLAICALAGPGTDEGVISAAEQDLHRAPDDWLVRSGRGLPLWVLPEPNLGGAQLKRTDLSLVQLQGADLSGARLEHAILRFAHLEGVNLTKAQLQGADLFEARLEGAFLFEARLEGADLAKAHLQGARLNQAQLQGANLSNAQLQGADLSEAQLEGANLTLAELQRASLSMAHLQRVNLSMAQLGAANLSNAQLQGANLSNAQLQGADLRGAFLDTATVLLGAMINSVTGARYDTLDGIQVADTRWGGVNLATIGRTWRPPLGDEIKAKVFKVRPLRPTPFETTCTGRPRHIDRAKRRMYSEDLYRTAVRANRQLAVALSDQGMNEEAARFAYRAQVLQRTVYRLEGWRSCGRYLFSGFLDIIAGYGYQPIRSVIAYLLLISVFAAIYYGLGVVGGPHLSLYEAFVVSLTAFHGRGFFATAFQPRDPQAGAAAVEAVLGLLIEISFIATFTQRFFGSK